MQMTFISSINSIINTLTAIETKFPSVKESNFLMLNEIKFQIDRFGLNNLENKRPDNANFFYYTSTLLTVLENTY